MLRAGLFLLFLSLFLGAATLENLKWSSGESYLIFLERAGLPQDLYYAIDKEDQKLTEEIRTGVKYQVLRDSNETIEQVLIPINDELQLHIHRDKNGEYAFDAIPIISEARRESVTLHIENSPSYDILKATGSQLPT